MKLRDAIDSDVFIIDSQRITDDDMQTMNIDELETLRMRINKKINGLSMAIKEKQIEYANGGQGATTEWRLRRQSALSINKRVLGYVKFLIKKRLRSGRTISDHFMDQAKAVLPRKDFELILTNANNESKKHGDGV